jgi:uncharacterized protein (TIGR00369 family)
MKISNDQYCFICGPGNPVGLQAKINVDQQSHSAACTLVIPMEYQGWKDLVHGGILSALLDEVCAYAGMTMAKTVVTGELKTRFHKPVPVGREVTVTAKVIRRERRVVLVEAQVTMEGSVLTSAEAKMVIVNA